MHLCLIQKAYESNLRQLDVFGLLRIELFSKLPYLLKNLSFDEHFTAQFIILVFLLMPF
jgi:hypothetical protein